MLEEIQLQQVLPQEIEKRSFEIITEELGNVELDPLQAPIIKRCAPLPNAVVETPVAFESAPIAIAVPAFLAVEEPAGVSVPFAAAFVPIAISDSLFATALLP